MSLIVNAFKTATNLQEYTPNKISGQRTIRQFKTNQFARMGTNHFDKNEATTKLFDHFEVLVLERSEHQI